MPGPELEQGEIVELDEAVEMNPEPEQIDHDIVDAEHSPSFSWILKMGNLLSIYTNYRATELGIAVIER